VLTASFPSPAEGVLHLGPLPLRAYAFCIVLGIVVSVILAEQRLRARGAPEGAATEIATWGVPFGLVGSRIYHVITTPEPYFGANGHLVDALKIWNGGLGIWGGIAGGFLGGAIAVRRMGLPILLCADAVGPPIVVAQAIGRWGNYFNQELYGRATDLPWAVEIDPAHRVDSAQATYHPTFLYESLWNIGVAAVCIWADRRYRLGKGRVFALYVALYCLGRAWVEALRVDEAHRFFGLRLNDYVSLLLFLAGIAYLVVRRGQREPETAAAHGDPVPPLVAADDGTDSAEDAAENEPGTKEVSAEVSQDPHANVPGSKAPEGNEPERDGAEEAQTSGLVRGRTRSNGKD
jgi:prolipoprotein diacylglyceryl transferase